MFAHSLRKFSMRDWGIEQKWMSILLPLLLLYNGESEIKWQFSFSLFKYYHCKFELSVLSHINQTRFSFFITLSRSLPCACFCVCLSCFAEVRSLLPIIIPGEQLVPRDPGCLPSGLVPLCPAALLALCLSRNTSPGGYSYSAPLPYLMHSVHCCMICALNPAQVKRSHLTYG